MKNRKKVTDAHNPQGACAPHYLSSINPKMIFYLRATFMVLTPLAVCTFTT